MPMPKSTAATAGTVVSHLYTAVYNKPGAGGSNANITLQSPVPFLMPALESSVEIRHKGKTVAGKVASLQIGNDTFPDGAGYGSREYFIATLK